MKRVQDWCRENGKALEVRVDTQGFVDIAPRTPEALPVEGWTYEMDGVWCSGHGATLDEAFDQLLAEFAKADS